MTEHSSAAAGDDRRSRIARLLEEVALRRIGGEPVSDEWLISSHADLMPELADELSELRFVLEARRHAAARKGSSSPQSTIDGKQTRPPVTAPPSFPGYRIISEIHRGGQGVVYEALQESTQRRVAIKVPHDDQFADSNSAARFEQEVRILAQLKHANIVTIHDRGTSDAHSFFVMDYIAGRALDKHVESAPIGMRERLVLFAKICEAVNAAHLIGVIHRDLKPSNICVDSRGEPHILDFGLAKTSPGGLASLERITELTTTGQFVGSLQWASPEQVESRPGQIDVRTDVYSLGVILYELLTGSFPYAVTGNIREAVDNILQARPANPRELNRRVDDELMTIVLKCLAKDRERRYQNAGELARDVRSYLNGEPIEAKRDSGWYVLRKMVRRHRLPATFGALFAVLLLVTAVSLLAMYREQLALRQTAQAQTAVAGEQRDRAELEASKARKIQDFLADMLLNATPEQGRGKDITVSQVLAATAERVEAEFAEQPEVEGFLRSTLGRAYLSLGDYEPADVHLTRAYELLREASGPASPETLKALQSLSRLRWLQDRAEESELLVRRQLLLIEEHMPEDRERRLEVLNNLATLLSGRGALAEAKPMLREVLALRRELLGADHEKTLGTATNLAMLLIRLGRLDEAETLLRDALAGYRLTLGDDHPQTLDALNNLAGVNRVLARWEEAETLYRQSIETAQRVRGGTHPNTLTAMNNLGLLLRSRERYAEAEELLAETLALRRQVLRDGHQDTLTSMVSLAIVQMSQDQFAKARPLLEEAVEAAGRHLSEGDPLAAAFRYNYGRCLLELREFEVAERELDHSFRSHESAYGRDDERTQRVVRDLVRLYDEWGKPDRAAIWRARTSSEADPR